MTAYAANPESLSLFGGGRQYCVLTPNEHTNHVSDVEVFTDKGLCVLNQRSFVGFL